MELRHYWEAVKGGRRIILAIFLLFLCGGAVLVYAKPQEYSSRTSMYVATSVDSADPKELSERSAVAQQRVLSYTQIINGNVLAREVSDRLGTKVDPDEVTASLTGGTTVIVVTVVDPDADRAQAIAAEYADLAPAAIRELERSDSGGWQVDVSVIDDAGLGEPIGSGSPWMVMPFAMFFGLGAGVVAAIVVWVVRRELTEAPAAGSE